MTVCIAAICEDQESRDTIVCVSDMKLSQGHYSEDVATIKLRAVHKHWHVMIAGLFGQRQRIVDEVVEAFRSTPDVSSREMQDAFVGAYQRYGRQLATESVLAPYGLKFEEFLSSRGDLGDAIYERLWGEIVRTKVGCEFLVCGFDDAAHIFSVSNPTIENPSFVTYHDDLGFGTLGSGAYLAESTLYGYRQSFIDPINVTIYQACAAKFSSETATDVGSATHINVIQKGNKIEYDSALAKKLKEIWQENRPIVPDGAFKIIEKSRAHKMSDAITKSNIIIEVEGVDLDQLSTPGGLRQNEEIFRRNEDKLRKYVLPDGAQLPPAQ